MRLVAAAEGDGQRTGVRIKHAAGLSRAKPNAAPFSPRPAMDDLDELRGRAPPKQATLPKWSFPGTQWVQALRHWTIKRFSIV